MIKEEVYDQAKCFKKKFKTEKNVLRRHLWPSKLRLMYDRGYCLGMSLWPGHIFIKD